MSVIFLTEAGDSIGLGHLRRCQELAELIEGSRLITLNEFNWIKFILDVSKDDIVVIDSYKPQRDTYEKYLQKAKKVIAIDDYQRIDYGSSIVIQPDIFSGNDLFILRDSFKEIKYEVKKEVKNIIVSVGGSDYRGIIPNIMKMLQSLKGINSSYIGADNPIQKDLVPKIISNADVFISGFGQTMFELSYMGIPTIGIQIDEDQKRIADFFSSKGLTRHNKWNEVDLYDKLRLQIETSYQKYAFRKNLSKKLKQLIDGKGKERIIKIING